MVRMMTSSSTHQFVWLLSVSALLMTDAFAGIQSPSTRQQPQQHRTSTSSTTLTASTTTATDSNQGIEQQDSILSSITYEIEKIPLRIGHGFDIHRMAPIQDAGQPIVIGGVEITHKDQKVCFFARPFLCGRRRFPTFFRFC